jgi:hypothetical protein
MHKLEAALFASTRINIFSNALHLLHYFFPPLHNGHFSSIPDAQKEEMHTHNKCAFRNRNNSIPFAIVKPLIVEVVYWHGRYDHGWK